MKLLVFVRFARSCSWWFGSVFALGLAGCGGPSTGTGGSGGTGGASGSGGFGGTGGVGPAMPPGWTEATDLLVDSTFPVMSISVNASGDAYMAYVDYMPGPTFTGNAAFMGAWFDHESGWGDPLALSAERSCNADSADDQCGYIPMVTLADDGTASVLLYNSDDASANGRLLTIFDEAVIAEEPVFADWGLHLGVKSWGDIIGFGDGTLWARQGGTTRRFSGGAWGAEEVAPMVGMAMVAADDGTAVIVGLATIGYMLQFSAYDNGWGPAQDLDPDCDWADWREEQRIRASAAAGGWAVVGWVHETATGGRQVYACVIDNGVCLGVQELSTGENSWGVEVVIDETGFAQAAWLAYDAASGLGRQGIARSYVPGTGWGAAEVFAEGEIEPSGMRFGRTMDSTVGVVWVETSTGNYYYSLNATDGLPAVSTQVLVRRSGGFDFAVHESGRGILTVAAGGTIETRLYSP